MHPNPLPTPNTPSPTPSPLPVSRPSDDVSYNFITSTMGWALVATSAGGQAGQFSVFKTVDGAKHWLKQLTGSQGVAVDVDPHSAVKFFDKSNGFVVVSELNDLLYRTTDGGAHWHSVALPGPQGAVISFSDPSNGWLLVPASRTDRTVNLYGTTDGGGTWQRLPDPPRDVCLHVSVSCPPLARGGVSVVQVPVVEGLGKTLARWASITFRGQSEGW